MRYVIIRDDDTNALTPVDCLEQLYRPFLDRGFPVNLATIPHVRTDVKIPSGEIEGFLSVTPEVTRGPMNETVPIGTHTELLRYLKANPEYHIVHHGWQHDYFEFDRPDAADVAKDARPGGVAEQDVVGEGDERRALAAGGAVGPAEVADDGAGRPGREQRWVQQLDRVGRRVVRRLPVRSHRR